MGRSLGNAARSKFFISSKQHCFRRTTTGSASGEKSFSYGQNKNSLIYLKLRFANPTKIYQGGPNHEREGHK